MTLRAKFLLALCAATVALAACGVADNTAKTTNTTNTTNRTNTTNTTNTTTAVGNDNTVTTTTSTTTTTTSTSGSGAYQTGVASCDEYLARAEKCLNNPNVPESVRASYRTAYEQNRDAWKQAAANPQTKAQLEVSCKQALDAAKPTFDQFCK